jgi:hypothetical protein
LLLPNFGELLKAYFQAYFNARQQFFETTGIPISWK